MCGIAGLFQFEPRFDGATLEKFGSAMARAQAHRGPDDEGIWVSPDNRCCLSHRRLSIIDPSSAGHQPMLSADRRAAISFNGEIYNYRDLAAELESSGHPIRTRTDTEVLLEAVRCWGPDVFLKLDGMYAFAFYDIANHELWIARDPFGEKPLYYLNDGKVLAFSSELQALEMLPFFDDRVGEEALAEFLSFQYIGAPRTLYQSVFKLPPAHFMRVRADGRVTTYRYFEYNPSLAHRSVGRSLDDLADELEEILLRLIERRMISDVPLGAFLSGGVDSSTVCALIRKKMGLALNTFSIGFTGSPESEHEQARRYAEHIGTEHHEKLLTPDATEFLLHSGRYLDEPNGDTSCLPTYLLSGFARERVTVAISGDGGDEMFGGYGRYFDNLEAERRARRKGRELSPGDRYYSGMILVFPDEQIRDLFGRVPPMLADRLRCLRHSVNQAHGSEELLLASMRMTDTQNYMPGAVLAKVDRMSMQHSLEVRTPFLSIELARFAQQLPLDALYRKGQGKRVLKRLARRYLPAEWLDMPKRGFGLPVSKTWGRERLLQTVGRLVDCADGRLVSVLGRARVSRFIERQHERRGFNSYQLWAVGILESFLRRRPASLPAYAEAPPLQRLEVATPLPASLGLRQRTQQPPAHVVLFCRNGVPAWWRSVREHLTIVAPFSLTPPADVAFARCEWTNPDPAAFDSLRPAVPRGSIAVLAEFDDAAGLRPGFLSDLESLGVTELFRSVPGNVPAPIIDVSEFCRLSRACRGGLLPPGRRLGKWGRPISQHVGFLYRSRFPPLMGTGSGSLGNGQFAVIERRRPLLLGEAEFDDIQRFGNGRFSVRDRRVLFSTSDNSDPRRNRRGYRLLDLSRHGIQPWQTAGTPGSQDAHLRALVEFIQRDNAATDDGPDAPEPGDTIALFTGTLSPGGAERQWVYLAQGLASRGFRVVFFVQGLQGIHGHYLPLLEQSCVEIRCHTSWQPTQPAAGEADDDTLMLAGLAPDFLRIDLRPLISGLREVDAKYMACQLDSTNILGGLAGIVTSVRRVLLSFRNVNPTNFSYLRIPWFHDYYRALVRSGRIVLSGNSRFGNDDYARWLDVPADRVRLIYNGFSAQALAPGADRRVREELGVPEDALVVCGLFRLSEEKDPDTFLEVARRLVETRPNIVVLQAGAGGSLDSLRRRVRRMGLSRRIHFMGPRRDANAILATSDLLLMTSIHEGVSNALLEAQYLRVPVIATAVGGTPEAIADGETGMLVPPGQPEIIARRCLELLDDPDRRRRMGEAGRQRVRTIFTLDNLVDRTLDAFRISR